MTKGEFDLIEISKKIWSNKKKIFVITAFFMGVGLFIALFGQVEYTSEAILMPESQQQGGGAGQLLKQFGGAFGLGGVDFSQSTGGVIPPILYSRVVNSMSFQIELINKPIRFNKEGITTTIPDFFKNHYKLTPTEFISEYTIGLPRTILRLIKGINGSDLRNNTVNYKLNYIQIGEGELADIERNKNRIRILLDEETGLLYTKATLHDARAAADLNQNVIDLLKKYVTDYKIEKVKQNFEFVLLQYNKSKVKFKKDQKKLADFKDRNISISTASANTRLEILQDEKNISYNVYNSLSQRLEQVKIQLNEQTPVFKIIQPVNVPAIKSSSRKSIVVIKFIVLGLILASLYIMLKQPIVNLIKQIIN